MPQIQDVMPLTGPPPAEVPLPNAPLALVVAQIRFPTLLAVRNPDKLETFQEAIRHSYPYLEREDVQILVSSGLPARSAVHWRFWDETRRWRATLTQDFLALEALSYTSRDDFVRRFGEVVSAFSKEFKPTHSSRLGVRYIDQIRHPSLDKVDMLIRPEVLGVFGRKGNSHLEHLITQLSIDAEPGRLIGKWGILPKGTSPDPMIAPIEEDSWILDLDVSVPADARFSAEDLVQNARACAERVYSVFMWMVTKDFLAEYGGDVR